MLDKLFPHWIISQHWSDLLFINYEVDKDYLRKIVPSYLELDLHDGRAFTSVVPFCMSRVRFPFTPFLPFSSLNELNLRTYVTCNGVRGIYFFTLDSNHRFANLIARNFFNLPYNYRKVELCRSLDSYITTSPEVDIDITIEYSIEKDSFEEFITERYFLFTDNGRDVFQGQVFHKPWKLNAVSINHVKEGLHDRFGIHDTRLHSSFYSSGFDVYFKPFKILRKI